MRTGILSSRTVMLSVAVALALSGCGGQADDDETASAGAAADAEAEADDGAADDGAAASGGEDVQLTFGHFVPPTHLMNREVAEYLAEELDQRTDGRITVDIQPGGALGPPDGQFENIQAGAFDLGFGFHFYTPGRFPLQTVMEFPFLFDSAEGATSTYLQLYDEFPELQAEMDGVKVLGLWTHDPGELMSSTDPIEEPADLQGMRIRSPGPLQNSLIEALGGAPVTAPAPEIYDSVDRGVVDGVIGAYSLIESFNLDEILSHVSKGGFYVATAFLVMNQDTWDQLSAEDQALLEEVAGEELSLRVARAYDGAYDAADERVTGAGIEVTEFDSADLEVWRDAASGVVEEWIDEREQEGLPAREIYERLLELAESNG